MLKLASVTLYVTQNRSKQIATQNTATLIGSSVQDTRKFDVILDCIKSTWSVCRSRTTTSPVQFDSCADTTHARAPHTRNKCMFV